MIFDLFQKFCSLRGNFTCCTIKFLKRSSFFFFDRFAFRFRLEKLLKMGESFFGLRDNEESIGIFIQSMNQSRSDKIIVSRKIFEMLVEKTDHRRSFEVPNAIRMGEYSFRFIEDKIIFFFMDDWNLDFWTFIQNKRTEISFEIVNRDEIVGSEFVGFFDFFSVDGDPPSFDDMMKKIPWICKFFRKPFVDSFAFSFIGNFHLQKRKIKVWWKIKVSVCFCKGDFLPLILRQRPLKVEYKIKHKGDI